MHLCADISTNQDHFSLANVSLNRLSCKSGSFPTCKCIPEQTFLQIRITFPLHMHPCQTFSANQDHFSLANASLPDLFCKSGSLPPRKCIPAWLFQQIRITFPSQMHPCQNFPAYQDHFPPRKCIPERTFLQIRITFPSQMHP